MDCTRIQAQADIDALLFLYAGFHDSCICSINYESGAKVDSAGAMHGASKDCRLLLRLQSQMVKGKTLELQFIGLRRLNLTGFQDSYFSDIMGCHLSFYQDRIVWADSESFDPARYECASLLHEPMTTFVISDELSWRFV